MTYSPVTESLWIPPSLESLVCTRSPPFCDLEYDPRWAPSRSYGSQPRHPVVNGSRLVVLLGHPPENEQRYKKPSFAPTGAIEWTVWLVVTHVYFSTLEKGGWSQLTRVFFQGWLKHQPVWCHCPVALRRRSLTSVLTLVSRQRHQPRRGGWSLLVRARSVWGHVEP